MRLYEIISENQLILELSGIDVDFVSTYNFICDAHNLLVSLNSPYRHRKLHGNIDILESDIHKFLNIQFFPDIDIENLVENSNDILTKLDIIRKQIP